MNFDGKAFVKNTTTKFFTSDNGYAFVRSSSGESVSNLYPIKGGDTALVTSITATYPSDLIATNKMYSKGLVPYTVQVYENKENSISLSALRFIITKDSTVHNTMSNIRYIPKKIYVSRLQPTNVKCNPKSAIVYDSDLRETQTPFAGVSVNVNSKVEVVIPDKITDYSDMSLVVQKNSFIEIKLSESVTDVSNLPDALMYLPGYIKGTFTQSGEYNIKIKYPDGEQILNIVVPYYQRLL